MFETAESILDMIIHYGVLLLEVVGASFIFFRAFLALVSLFRRRAKPCQEHLTEGITIGLSFLLASEVLKTIIDDHDWRSIGMTCAILLIRAAISILVHWEKKMETHTGKE